MKIIETFSKIDDYRRVLKNVYEEMKNLLATDSDGYEKRAEANDFRNKSISIKSETSKYFDCIDGLRDALQQEMSGLMERMKQLNEAEKSVKRLRKAADKVAQVKSVTPKKELDDIDKLFNSIENHMTRYLTYVNENN